MTERIAKVQKQISCPSKLATVKLAATAMTNTDEELTEVDDGSDILSQEEVKLYRAIQESASGKRAEEATAHLRAHERATAARDALKPLEDIQLIGLQPSQVLPRVEAKLAELQRQKVDDAARWQRKEEEDDLAADVLEKELGRWIQAYTDELQQARERRKAERLKWAAAHKEQRDRIDAKIGEVTKLLAKAKADPASLVAQPVADAAAASVEDSPMDAGGTSASDPKAAAATTKPVAADAAIRPMAVLPQIALEDEAQLARLARAQAVIDQAAQQDSHVELALRDLGLNAKEVDMLIGSAAWQEKYPEDSPQPQDDWPLPKRIVALVGKAVSRIEV